MLRIHFYKQIIISSKIKEEVTLHVQILLNEVNKGYATRFPNTKPAQ